MTRVAIAILIVATMVAAGDSANATPADAMPFGRITKLDLDRFQEFALKRAGFDVKAEMARVYGPGGKVDEEALGRVFSFSRQFNTFDNYARTYGQIIYDSLLNLGEPVGVLAYTKVIDRQPPDVQQRIRDFLFYGYIRCASKQRLGNAVEEARRIYPTLFPRGFQFGRKRPVFAN